MGDVQASLYLVTITLSYYECLWEGEDFGIE